MEVTRLDIRDLRGFREARLAPSPGLNVITGRNGAGKTSVLEALHLMAYGRSFRGRVRDSLVRNGASDLEVFVEWRERAPHALSSVAESTVESAPDLHERIRRAGLRHSGQQWTGRLDGEAVNHLGELCAALAVVSFEPGSHALVNGPAEVRRRFMDWGLFHVEPRFLGPWRRYSKALKQRNALLKSRGDDSLLDVWDRELVEAGEPLSVHRERYLQTLQSGFSTLAGDLAPGLGGVRLEYLAGWKQHELPLADALLLARSRDRLAGFTSVGPHRADWRVEFGSVPGRDALSRGQAKLTALTALLAQADLHARVSGDWPVLGFDDLASELDRDHQRKVIDWGLSCGAQVFITGTDLPSVLADKPDRYRLFHVEQGVISPV